MKLVSRRGLVPELDEVFASVLARPIWGYADVAHHHTQERFRWPVPGLLDWFALLTNEHAAAN